MTKILIVATYPIKNAQHGGQRRVAAIVEAYKEAFEDVLFVGVFPPDYYSEYSPNDIVIQGETRRKTVNAPYTSDIICGEAIYKDRDVRKKFEKILRTFKPDIIQVEQIFPYLGVKPLLKELSLKPKIIQSSQNIEYSMKQKILENSGYAHEAEVATALIKACETDLSKNADLTFAVSPEDARELEALGGKKAIVALNGINKLELTKEGEQYWADYKETNALSQLITFVGSAHPPNWHGFLAMVGDRMGFLPSSKKLMLAGSISDYFQDAFKDLQPEHATFWMRVVCAGRLSDELLTGLIDASEVLLLPITEGGGSNLKTAEAILSDKKVVATSYAFRAFEEYQNLPNIYIADTAGDFRNTILKALKAPYITRTKEQKQLAEKVQWQYCLKPMIDEVKEL